MKAMLLTSQEAAADTMALIRDGFSAVTIGNSHVGVVWNFLFEDDDGARTFCALYAAILATYNKQPVPQAIMDCLAEEFRCVTYTLIDRGGVAEFARRRSELLRAARTRGCV